MIQTHNGTLVNWQKFAQARGFWTTTNIDSHGMLKLFEAIKTKDGVENYIAEGLQEIEGAYAVMIHDTEIPNRIQFFRNKERPLFYGGIDNDNIYFSSLEEGLLAIGVPEENISEVTPDVIYTANIENNTVVITQEPWVKIKKELSKPNFQMAPHNPQQKNEKVTLWGQSSTNTSRNDIMESMKEVFSRSQKNKKNELRENTTEKNTTDEIIKLNTKVEVLNSIGMTLYGNVVCVLHPTYIVSVIEQGKSRLEFCHRDVMIELGEQVVEHIPSVSLASIDIGNKIDCRDGDTYMYGVTVNSIYTSTKEVEISFRSASGSVVRKIIPLIDVLRIVSKTSEKTTDYACDKCFDTGIVTNKLGTIHTSCECSMSNNIEIIEEDLVADNPGFEDYDDFEDAASLYTGLIQSPGFVDDFGIFEQMNAQDVILKSIQLTLDKGMVDDNDVKKFKEDIMEARGELLETMVENARKLESSVV